MDKLTKLKNDTDMLFKIILIGNSSTGKTNIVSRLTRNEFNTDSRSTIGVEFATYDTVIDKNKIRLQIWDTAGQERYRAISKCYYRSVSGVIAVFDISKYDTFESIDQWMNELNETVSHDMILILVGNKCDLEQKRAVPRDVAIDYANKRHMIYFETSASNNINIQAVFDKLASEMYNKLHDQATLPPIRYQKTDIGKVNDSRCCF